FQNRYNATSQAVRSLLDSADIGKVLGGSATVMWQRSADYYRAKPWRGRWETSGGGLLINQAINTLDLLQWFLGDVSTVRGQVATHVLADTIEVEDTAELVLSHSSGARSVLYATLANPANSPVTLEIIAEDATLFLRNDLTISYADGRVEVVPERAAPTVGRAYWGVSHELLIRDFYNRLGDPEPFWISPREAAKSLRLLKEVYAQSGANTIAVN
ncbi:MAG: Gfo/Idh/MocA family oxidoreductase, partial [Propionibacteriaceae bacterium]|nr:Gfo/Idh/MocA family oxidoreductase [Propionibacteriaceae bacterium]